MILTFGRFDMLAFLAQVRVERRLELTNLPENWTAVLGLALLGCLCWWIVRTYRAEARAGSTLAARMFMASLRCTVIALLATISLEPVLASYLHQHIESYTLVLVDGSSSINIKDYYLDAREKEVLTAFFNELGHSAGATGSLPASTQTRGSALADQPPVAPHEPPYDRAGLVELILNGKSSAFLKDLTRHNRVKLYTFSDKTTELATLAARRDDGPGREAAGNDKNATTLDSLDLQLSHSGAATNLGQTLRHAVDSLDGVIAAVVVISDGGFNQGESVDVLGQFARARSIPIYTIGVGESAPPRNIKVTELVAPANAFINDPFEIQARIEVAGMDDELVTVELYAQQAGEAGGPTLVSRKSIQVRPGVAAYSLSFEHRSQRAGRFSFQIRASVGVAEPITEDNTGRAYVNFLDNKVKVLLVSGGPSWTYRFVSRLLQRDETFDLSCWLQSADRSAVRDGNTIIDHLPDNASELFKYDVIVLLDPDAGQLPTRWAELIDTHVTRHAAGLMYCAARQRTPAFFHHPVVEPLIKLLPVVRHPEADLILNEIGYYQRRSFPIEFPRGALAHPIFSGRGAQFNPRRLVEGEIGEIWRRLGQVYWHYPVKHEKAAATVLMRHGHPRMRNSAGGHVLLARQFVGAGRTTFLGFDGTWRWRRYGEELFNRFWVQNIRYLAEGRLLGGQARGRIQTDRDRYNIGEPIVFRARLSDSNYQPLTQPSIQLRITRDGEDAVPQQIILQQDPNRPDVHGGWYKGQFVPRQAARYTATIRLTGEVQKEDITITHQVDVRKSNLEILKPQMDRSQLITLAQQSAGGAYYEINQALILASTIPDRHETTITKGASEPLWDTGWMLTLLVGLLSLEWALRKKWQLL